MVFSATFNKISVISKVIPIMTIISNNTCNRICIFCDKYFKV